MSEREQINAFGNDLDALVQRYADEFELTYASIVGCLYMKSHLLCVQASEKSKHEENDE